MLRGLLRMLCGMLLDPTLDNYRLDDQGSAEIPG